jgi:hypothetical protein
MGGRHPEGHITDPRNRRMKKTSRRQRRMEAPCEAGHGPEGSVATQTEWNGMELEQSTTDKCRCGISYQSAVIVTGCNKRNSIRTSPSRHAHPQVTIYSQSLVSRDAMRQYSIRRYIAASI